eukprot:CAMPEP_0206323538 /NCGR_PEP_ID=MMETSP0106_2-20121207/20034_1 /ASSEMBLY_ACC=CAM_ASM_000206 /TAXON_ID=81532 /ORGANISM="Acanthoeca-like sp., Strain 10tr" /LENGTH=49 /DNA_ID= /DNA_START= /DNA_END= /DNA_ORIENTATION=
MPPPPPPRAATTTSAGAAKPEGETTFTFAPYGGRIGIDVMSDSYHGNHA